MCAPVGMCVRLWEVKHDGKVLTSVDVLRVARAVPVIALFTGSGAQW
ncbi:MAG: hypothetical protein R3198_16455 [Marinobacter sp.]|nr:hypothetical protein [Marinobacter sp.]